MDAVWVPRFVLASPAIDLTLELPMRPWDYLEPSIGAQRWSAALYPAGYEVPDTGKDLALRLRVEEWERAALAIFLRTVRAPMRAFTFYPDANGYITTASYTVWLLSPAAGTDIMTGFTRMQPYIGAFDYEIIVRKTDNSTDWDLDFLDQQTGS